MALIGGKRLAELMLGGFSDSSGRTAQEWAQKVLDKLETTYEHDIEAGSLVDIGGKTDSSAE